mgnify:CR=1 FL=1
MNMPIPRHTARIYAISINSVHREAVAVNGVNVTMYNILPIFRWILP